MLPLCGIVAMDGVVIVYVEFAVIVLVDGVGVDVCGIIVYYGVVYVGIDTRW